jgi:hypothetical protein
MCLFRMDTFTHEHVRVRHTGRQYSYPHFIPPRLAGVFLNAFQDLRTAAATNDDAARFHD